MNYNVENSIVMDGGTDQTNKSHWKDLLEEILTPSTKKFLHTSPILEGMYGLDLGCRKGKTSFLLSNKVGPNGHITGIDQNIKHLRIAEKEMAGSSINYVYKNILEWAEYQRYNFVYSRFLLNQLPCPIVVLKKAHKSLKKEGFIMLEEIDPSNFHCYPNSLAFDQYKALLSKIQHTHLKSYNTGSKLFHLLEQAGFKEIKVQPVLPTLLNGTHKYLASTILDNFSRLLIKDALIKTTELNKIKDALIAFENHPDTLIMTTNIYQAIGYKI